MPWHGDKSGRAISSAGYSKSGSAHALSAEAHSTVLLRQARQSIIEKKDSPASLALKLSTAAFHHSVDRSGQTPYSQGASEAFDMVYSGVPPFHTHPLSLLHHFQRCFMHVSEGHCQGTWLTQDVWQMLQSLDDHSQMCCPAVMPKFTWLHRDTEPSLCRRQDG